MKTSYAYGNGKGSPDIALNLYPLFKSLGLKNITVRPHVIASFGEENIERSRALLNNLHRQLETVSEALIKNKLLTENDLQLAMKEVKHVSADTFIYQSLWIAEGIKG